MSSPTKDRTVRARVGIAISLLVAFAVACDGHSVSGLSRVPVLASITVTPNVSMPINGTQLYTAVGKDADGVVVTIAPRWSATGGGTINTYTGLFTAGVTLGTYSNAVQATSGGISGSASVVVIAGPLATITVTPGQDTMAISGTRLYSAVGRDAGANIIALAPAWSVVAGGGAISSGALFTAGPMPGVYSNTIRATSGGISGNATVTISQAVQAITFTQPATPATYGHAFVVTPTASGGLAVAVLATGGCRIADSTVTMTSGTADCSLTASQAGDSVYLPATSVVHIVAAGRLAASVTPDAAGKTAGATDSAFTGTLRGFLPADSVTAVYARTVGDSVGSYVISATLSPASTLGNYAVTLNSAAFVIGRASQSISFAPPAAPATYGSSFVLAPTSTSGLLVAVTASGGCVIAGPIVTMTSGTVECALDATQAGDRNHTAAPLVARSVAAAMRPASMTPDSAAKVFGAADPAMTGTQSGFLAADNVTITYSRVAGETVGAYLISSTPSSAGPLGNYSITANTAHFTITGGATQAITFAQPATPAVYGSLFAVAPTATSGLAVAMAASGGCRIAGGIVTMISGSVDCALAATQIGDASYGAAPAELRIVSAGLLAASITPNASGKTFGAIDPSFSGTLIGFLLPDSVSATYQRTAGESVGAYLINASPSPAPVLANYRITSGTAPFSITGGAIQAITFAPPATPAVYGSSFVVAPTASSGLIVSMAASGGCSVAAGSVTMTSGTAACVLTASEAGNAGYLAASNVVRTVVAARRAASLTPSPGSRMFGTVDPGLTGTEVGFLAADSVTATYARVAGDTVGRYVISATPVSSSGLGNYSVSSSTAFFTITGGAAQSIAFAQPATPAIYGSSFAVTPSTTSGLAVTIVASGGCSFASGSVTMISGTLSCTLTGSQAGNASFGAAGDVARIVAANPLAASVTPSASSKLFGGTDPALSGILSGFLAADSVSASYTRTAGEGVGSYAIGATLTSAGALSNYTITSGTAAFVIGLASQTIAFSQPATPATYGGSFAVAPSATSGLAVTIVASGGCSIAAGTITMLSGTLDCTLTASQPGDASYTAAAAQARTVVASPLAATVTPSASAKLFGAADPAFTGSLTAFLPGDSVHAAYARTAGESVGSYAIGATLTSIGALSNYTITSGTAAFVIGLASQSITFSQPVTPATYGSSFAVRPSTTLGLAVTIVASGGCSFASGTVTMISGTLACTLTSSQAGNASFSAAGDVVRSVAASPLSASVSPGASSKPFGGTDPALSGILSGFLAADSVSASYTRTAGEGVGSYAIGATLTSAGALSNYTITSGTASFVIGLASQSIAFSQPATPANYGSSFAVTPSTTSGLPVTITASGGCSITGGTVTMISGTAACRLTGSQAGDASFTAAGDVVRIVAASPLAASVTPSASSKPFGGTDPVFVGILSGFLAADSVSASYTRTAGESVGSYAIGATLTSIGALSNYTITSGTAAFVIGLASQSIAFSQPATPASYGSSFTVTSTATSGLSVTLASTGGCTISGSSVTMMSGTTACVLTASQPGDASFAPASSVVRTVAATTLAASITPDAAGKVFGGVDPVLTGTLTGFRAADGVSAAYTRNAGESVGSYAIGATLTSTGTLSNYTITSGTAAFVIGLASQSITFSQPATPATYGSSFAVAPSATSGLAVTIVASGGCTISGSSVTMTSGTNDCVLTASQPGDAGFNAANNVVRSVAATTLAASITPAAAGKVFGASDPILTGTLAGFLAGDSVTAIFGRTAGETFGSYAISATASPAGVLGNYTITYPTASFVIGMGRVTSFAVLGGTGASSCGGAGIITGDLGVAPGGAMSGFPAPCTISAPGAMHDNDTVAAGAMSDLAAASTALANLPCQYNLTGQGLGGMTLVPGVYCFASTAQLTGTVTLDGPSDGIWVFQIGTALTTAAASSVVLAGNARAGNVYWRFGTSATFGASNLSFQGNLVATGSITMGAGTKLIGRALAMTAVIMDDNAVVLP